MFSTRAMQLHGINHVQYKSKAMSGRSICVVSLTHLRLVYLYGTSANRAESDQTPQNAASDQVLYCHCK